MQLNLIKDNLEIFQVIQTHFKEVLSQAILKILKTL
jgi:hypothetical protein